MSATSLVEAVHRAETAPSFQAQVWRRLSAIDCSKRVEKKQNLTYLSWAWAWGTLMENYPGSTYSFDDPFIFPDGTGEIWVEVTVREGEAAWTQKMWLPMLNFKNAPVTNPNAAQINYTRMRVLTKCLAMFGLGHYIYAGEDLPNGTDPVAHQQEGPEKPKRDTSVAAMVLDGIDIDPQDIDNPEMAMRGALHKLGKGDIDKGEAKALIMDAVRDLSAELKIALWKRFDSVERRNLKEVGGL